MTTHRHLKARIRARMSRTGERYTTARRHILRQITPSLPADPATRAHQPGQVPATTALGTLLRHAGLVAPHTGAPFSEAMLFGLAGGIGLGIFSFFYEREDLATLFIAGRHQWHDDLTYLTDFLGRLGVTPSIHETTGARTAAGQLRDLLAEVGPCIAWVDAAGLPHRALPPRWSGSGYHVITVYRVDETAGTAVIGDLTDEPITLALTDLAQARGRIVKQRHRLLAVTPSTTLPPLPPLATLVHAGLRACHQHLLHPTLPSPANARLTALRTWADRMDGSPANERWERVYRPGVNFWRGLSAIYDCIEHYGTGGGLCRPLFADFLSEAAMTLGHLPLAALAERYAALGQAWSALAEAALPDELPLLAETRALFRQKAELTHAGEPAEAIQGIWQRLNDLERQAADHFPLSEAASRALRVALKERINDLYAGEVAAHDLMLSALPPTAI